MTEKDSNEGYRLGHTMLRVHDLDKSLDFYCRLMGMEVLRNTEYPDGRFTNVFIGYGSEATHTTIELTHNWDDEGPRDKGAAFGHLAFEVPCVYKACARLRDEGVAIVREPGPMKHGSRNLAFIEDPDGYKVELNESLVA